MNFRSFKIESFYKLKRLKKIKTLLQIFRSKILETKLIIELILIGTEILSHLIFLLENLKQITS